MTWPKSNVRSSGANATAERGYWKKELYTEIRDEIIDDLFPQPPDDWEPPNEEDEKEWRRGFAVSVLGVGRPQKSERNSQIVECVLCLCAQGIKRPIAIKRAAKKFDLLPDSVRKILRVEAGREETRKKNAALNVDADIPF